MRLTVKQASEYISTYEQYILEVENLGRPAHKKSSEHSGATIEQQLAAPFKSVEDIIKAYAYYPSPLSYDKQISSLLLACGLKYTSDDKSELSEEQETDFKTKLIAAYAHLLRKLNLKTPSRQANSDDPDFKLFSDINAEVTDIISSIGSASSLNKFLGFSQAGFARESQDLSATFHCIDKDKQRIPRPAPAGFKSPADC